MQGSDPGDLQGTGCNDRARASIARSCAHAGERTALFVDQQVGAAIKREEFPEDADRIQGVEAAVLGQAHLGEGILLCNDRSRR